MAAALSFENTPSHATLVPNARVKIRPHLLLPALTALCNAPQRRRQKPKRRLLQGFEPSISPDDVVR